MASSAVPTNSVANIARTTHWTFVSLLAAWSCAWICKAFLDSRVGWLRSESVTFGFWLAAKIFVWILPSVLLIRASGRDWKTVVNVGEWRRWTAWGLAVGGAIAASGLLRKAIEGTPLVSHGWEFATWNVLIVAPLFEEFFLRASVLGNLTPAMGFPRANIATSLYFVALHVPGWYMMGNLGTKVGALGGGAFSIFVLGLLFGWTAHKGRSFLGATLAHALNNFVG